MVEEAEGGAPSEVEEEEEAEVEALAEGQAMIRSTIKAIFNAITVRNMVM